MFITLAGTFKHQFLRLIKTANKRLSVQINCHWFKNWSLHFNVQTPSLKHLKCVRLSSALTHWRLTKGILGNVGSQKLKVDKSVTHNDKVMKEDDQLLPVCPSSVSSFCGLIGWFTDRQVDRASPLVGDGGQVGGGVCWLVNSLAWKRAALHGASPPSIRLTLPTFNHRAPPASLCLQGPWAGHTEPTGLLCCLCRLFECQSLVQVHDVSQGNYTS